MLACLNLGNIIEVFVDWKTEATTPASLFIKCLLQDDDYTRLIQFGIF
jgi:hypothetical protein